MNTEAVICMALTRQRPSVTPLWWTSSSIFGVMLMNPRRSGTSNQRCSVSDFNRRILQTKCQTKSDNPVIKRDARLRFDSHLKEGIGIDSSVALQNPTHAQGPRLDRDR